MYLRKFFGFAITTLLTGLFLTTYFSIMDGYDEIFAPLGVVLAGTSPFILLIGMPVSMLSDYLTKNLYSKRRYIKAFFVHIIFGLIIGLVISFLFEGIFYLISSLIASFIFWLVDEILRKKI